eukprot:scpid78158/ scgid14494/ DnaJ homolog subfamily C member 16
MSCNAPQGDTNDLSGRKAVMKTILLLIYLALLCGSAWCEDLYRTLGVSRSANAAQIKRAYRQLAKEWHPDKNKGSGAQEKFIQINQAYEVLSDERKKKNYDMYGTTDGAPQRQQHDFRFHGQRAHGRHQEFFVFRDARGQSFFFHRPPQPSWLDSNYLLLLGAALALMLLIPMQAGQQARDGQQQNGQRRPHDHRAAHGTHADGIAEAQCTRLDEASFESFRMLPPGHIVFLLLVDKDPTLEKNTPDSAVISSFLGATSHYHGNQRYRFMYLVLSEHGDWCDELVSLLDPSCFEDDDQLEWQAGVVLALNLHRRYLSVFKPIEESQLRAEDDSVNDFLGVSSPDWQAGLDSPSAGHAAAERLSQDLRSRLPLWMDRHSDGSIPRLHVDKWPVLVS